MVNKKQRFEQILAAPSKVTVDDLYLLRTIVDEYPYFQAARSLYLKGLKDQSSPLYNTELQVTATHTTDRSILFEYITSPHFNQNHISDYIKLQQENIDNIEVHYESESVAGLSNHVDNVIELDNSIIKKSNSEANIKVEGDTSLLQDNAIAASGTVETLAHYTHEDSNNSAGVVNENSTLFTDDVVEPNAIIQEKQNESVLEMDKPLEFSKSEKHSFAEWLKLTSLKPIDRSLDSHEEQLKDIKEDLKNKIQENTDKKMGRMERVDRFLEDKPKIIPVRDAGKTINLAAFNPSSDQLMTQTLAQVYLAQKNYAKAIQAYEILVLQHPEKSGFFADQIREIKKLQSTDK